MKTLVVGAVVASFLTSAVASTAMAETPTRMQFVEKASASDTFEIDAAQLMVTSSNPAIKTFAKRMLIDHANSTMMVKAAARADHVTVEKPSLSIGQRTDLTALKVLPAGKVKDDLYVKQQKAAHDDALGLMRDYATNGSAPHLKQAASKIAPVVEQHRAMLARM